MIGLDTNVLVRYLAQDDKAQSAKASHFIETRLTDKSPGYINHIVLIETVWVLESCYAASKQAIANVIQQLASTVQLLLQDGELVLKALRLFESSNIDFPDALLAIVNEQNGCDTTVTFDKKAGKVKPFLLVK